MCRVATCILTYQVVAGCRQSVRPPRGCHEQNESSVVTSDEPKNVGMKHLSYSRSAIFSRQHCALVRLVLQLKGELQDWLG